MLQVTEITVQAKNVYGNVTLYPCCETSRLLAQLAGTKTITAQMERQLQSHGVLVWRVN